MLGPDAGLHAFQPPRASACDHHLRHVPIGLLGRHRSGPAGARFRPAIRLRHIQIIGLAWRGDHVISRSRNLTHSLLALPGHQYRVPGRNPAAIGRLVPGYCPPSQIAQHPLHPPQQKGLRLAAVSESFPIHQPGCGGRFRPGVLAHFIRAQMDEPEREQRRYLAKDGFQKIICAGQTGVERIVCIALYRPICVRWFIRVAQFRQGGQGSMAMARHIDFGQHVNVKRRAMPDQPVDIGPAVEPAISLCREPVLRQQRLVGPAPGGNIGQFRIGGDFQPPALVIAQMQMQHVQLQPGHNIGKAHQFVQSSEMPDNIHMRAAPVESRRIIDPPLRGDPVQFRVRPCAMNDLCQRDKSVKSPRRMAIPKAAPGPRKNRVDMPTVQGPRYAQNRRSARNRRMLHPGTAAPEAPQPCRMPRDLRPSPRPAPDEPGHRPSHLSPVPPATAPLTWADRFALSGPPFVRPPQAGPGRATAPPRQRALHRLRRARRPSAGRPRHVAATHSAHRPKISQIASRASLPSSGANSW